MLEVIKHERRVELAFEGLRYFDLVRWEELDERYAWYMANELPGLYKRWVTRMHIRGNLYLIAGLCHRVK